VEVVAWMLPTICLWAASLWMLSSMCKPCGIRMHPAECIGPRIKCRTNQGHHRRVAVLRLRAIWDCQAVEGQNVSSRAIHGI
jgi:hypothetical protein